jgi:hypothetical protein
MENWGLLNTDKNYMWVHLAGIPSAHVVIETDDPTEEEIEFARQCILAQTKKAPANSKIVRSKIKNLKRGRKPGEVVIIDKK